MFMVQPQAERRGIKLLCEIEDPEIKVKIDGYCLSRALKNLLDNALKYTEKATSWLALFVHPNRSVQIDVEDTGLGIESKNISKLLD